MLTTIAACLFMAFLGGAAFNAYVFWKTWVKKERSKRDLTLLWPGVCGVLALTGFPSLRLEHYFWLPLLLDVSCLMLIVVYAECLWELAKDVRHGMLKLPFLLKEELIGVKDADYEVQVNLYRTNSVSLVKRNIVYGWQITVAEGEWKAEDKRLVLKLDGANVIYKIDEDSKRYIWLSHSQPSRLDEIDLQSLVRGDTT